MEALYPETLANRFDHTLADLYQRLYQADCHWSKLENANAIEQMRSKRSSQDLNSTNEEATSIVTALLPTTTGSNDIWNTNTTRNDSNTFSDEEIRNETVKRLADAINFDMNSDVINDDHMYSIWVDIAHGLHKASITILAMLFVEVSNIAEL